MKEQQKHRMQSVKFQTIDNFLDYLPDDELKIVEFLRALILRTMPEAEERLAYNVPYYRLRANVCFLWPASVLWGKKKTYKGVRLGFVRGYLMEDSALYLQKGDRKQVYWRDFSDLSDIDSPTLVAYLHEAILVDEAVAQEKKEKKNNQKL
jgi:hypothetical protein